jgi:hypothetical protein
MKRSYNILMSYCDVHLYKYRQLWLEQIKFFDSPFAGEKTKKLNKSWSSWIKINIFYLDAFD